MMRPFTLKKRGRVPPWGNRSHGSYYGGLRSGGALGNIRNCHSNVFASPFGRGNKGDLSYGNFSVKGPDGQQHVTVGISG